MAKASRLCELRKTRLIRIVHRLHEASRRKFVPAGRLDQRPGRACYPENRHRVHPTIASNRAKLPAKENSPDKVSVASNRETSPVKHRARSRAKGSSLVKANNPATDKSQARAGSLGRAAGRARRVRRLVIRRADRMSVRVRVCVNSRRVRNSAAGFAVERLAAAGMIAAVDWKPRKGL